MRPLIGIPPCLDEGGRWRRGRDYHYQDLALVRAVDEAGGLPVLLPLQGEVDALVERIDGLLLPGGDDFPPPHAYPESVRFELAPERQIDFDRSVLAAAVSRSLPVLGICYGMQLLALHCGGALHYDLATDLPAARPHQLADADARHPLEIDATSRLGELLGGEVSVNSRHHQAVASTGSARAVARADDGVIEAIEVPGPGFALGVQWHPEMLEAEHRTCLFGAFVAASAERGAGEAAAGRR